MSDNNYPPEVKKKYYCVAGVYESEYAAVGHVAAIRRAGFKSEVMDAIDYRDTALESIATSLAELVKILPTLNLAAPAAEAEANVAKASVPQSKLTLQFMISRARKDLKMSQETLALLVGLSGAAICKYENGKCNLSEDNINRICEVLGISKEARAKCE